MAELNNDVQGFLSWLPGYLATCGDRRKKPVTLDDLECRELQNLGFLRGAVEAYKRHLKPPLLRPLAEMLTAEDLAFYQRQDEEVQGCLVHSIQGLDPGSGNKVDSGALKSVIEFIAGPRLKP